MTNNVNRNFYVTLLVKSSIALSFQQTSQPASSCMYFEQEYDCERNGM